MGNIREVLIPNKTVTHGFQRLDEATRAAREGIHHDNSMPVRETTVFISAITVVTPNGELTRSSRRAVRNEYRRR